MTKQQYFEMCEAMGSEPLEEEIPVDFEDLPSELQQTFYLYNTLQDVWDYMGGNYVGKNLQEFWKLVELQGIPREDIKYYYDIILGIDRVRSNQIRLEQKSKQKPA